ncbi:hypothetical protein [Vulcanisaeta distributa]|uniref:hypothetical protein n=1 Tax=Vulcanisaeta distributa TaxID=164451 RepID=UPI001FB34607|nr:hypothetical protein [Vulcanisaeta distributa]
MRSLGFRERDRRHNVTYMIWASRAVDLIRKMLGDSLIKALIEDLSALPDADKLRRLITLANMRVKPPLGRSSIEVAGIKMHVHVCNNGFVELMASRYDYNDAVEVLTRLKNAGYEEVKLGRRGGDRYVVYMGIKAIRKHPELVTKVCEVLRRMLEETVNEGKERRMKAITKAMTSLGCQ